jgi:predicted MFS family arabinose efflux permease
MKKQSILFSLITYHFSLFTYHFSLFTYTGSIAATIADFTIGWPGLLLQVFGAWLILKYTSYRMG